jgi:hypothetical protein
VGDERALLIGTLDGARRHILGGLDGLTDEQLRQPVLPSGWSGLGLVKHLTLADERYWFRCVLGGESTDYFPDAPGGDWEVTPSETANGILGAYRDEIVRANALLHTLSPDHPARWRDPRWTEWGMDFPDVRTVVLHMIIETATHAGHLDAARELIDGRLWVKQ